MTTVAPVAETVQTPYPYLDLPDFLDQKLADRALEWLETKAPWRLRVESFYEQHEFSLLSFRPPAALSFLVESRYVEAMTKFLRSRFDVKAPLALVNVSAHRLTSGQTIRVHNDYLGPEETHRVLIQLNRAWSMANGGLLMLFGSDRAEDVRVAILPRHGSAFAFEISPRSYHAVSTIRNGERFTLVYTFRVDH